jgi:hypothetical protein
MVHTGGPAAGCGPAAGIRQDGYVDAAQPADRTPADTAADPPPVTAPAATDAPAGAADTGPTAGAADAGRSDTGRSDTGPSVDAAGTGRSPDPDASGPRDGDEVDRIIRTKTRSERSGKDMAFSLLVLLVPIALFLGFYRIVLGGDQPVVIDPAPTVAEARAANAFPVAEASGLSGDWRVTAATFQRADDGRVLRIGYLTPEGAGVQLVQSNVPAERLLTAELSADARARGTARIGDRSWQLFRARPGEQALVLLEPQRTVIAVGAASEDELRELAAALR